MAVTKMNCSGCFRKNKVTIERRFSRDAKKTLAVTCKECGNTEIVKFFERYEQPKSESNQLAFC